MLKWTWRAEHAGHGIRVENSLFSERLFIDDQLVAQSRGLKMTSKLTAALPGRDGAEGQVIALVYQGAWGLQCSIVIGQELQTYQQ